MGSRARAPSGITLVELLVVMGMLTTLLSLGLFVSFSEYRGTHFRNERTRLVSVLQKARSEAVGDQCRASGCRAGAAHGVYLGLPSSYVLYEGDSYESRHETIDENIGIESTDVTFVGCRDVTFLPGSGKAECHGADPQIEVHQGERISTIFVSSIGRIWWDD